MEAISSIQSLRIYVIVARNPLNITKNLKLHDDDDDDDDVLHPTFAIHIKIQSNPVITISVYATPRL
jgi:hypothetical protein